jgi:drug/metabolite transporter (DMT)-like permease
VFAVGLVAALGASALFNVGIVLQAIEARRTPPSLALRLSLLGRLLRRPLWLLGLALGIVGVGPQVVAFADAPFVVVQPALAAGLLIVLFLGTRILAEPMGARALIAVIAIISGVALVAWGAPSHVEAHRGGAAVLGVMALLIAGGLLPFPLRGTRRDTAMPVIVASGCGFASGNVATKLFGDDVNAGHYPNAAAWAAVGLAMGVVATVTGMTAFQRRAATVVVPISTSVQTFLPIVLEPLFLRERWASAELYGVPIVLGLVIALIGSVLLTRTRAVSDLVATAGALPAREADPAHEE